MNNQPPTIFKIDLSSIHTRPEPAGRGYQACIDGDWRRWGRGDTVDEAIGSVIRGHATREPVRPDWLPALKAEFPELADVTDEGGRFKITYRSGHTVGGQLYSERAVREWLLQFGDVTP